MSVPIKYVAIPSSPTCLDGLNQEIYDMCYKLKEDIEEKEFIEFTGLFGSKPKFYFDTIENTLYGDFSGEDGFHSLKMNFALLKEVIELDLLESRLKTPMYLNNGNDMDKDIKPHFKARPATLLECTRAKGSGFHQKLNNYNICFPETTTDDIKHIDIGLKEMIFVVPIISIDSEFTSNSIEELIFHLAQKYKIFPSDGEHIFNSQGFIDGFMKDKDYLVYNNNIVINEKYCMKIPPPIARENDIIRIKNYYMDMGINGKRVSLPAHNESVFDVNHGHWGLYCFVDIPDIPANPSEQERTKIETQFKKIEQELDNTEGTEFRWYDVSNTQIYAANPADSISRHPVAVDFGTTSTVAAYVDEIMNSIGYLQIGGITTKGEDTEDTEDMEHMKDMEAHYENPTILMYRDIKEFEEAYRKLPNLPYTKERSIYTAHTAMNEYKTTRYTENNLELNRFDKLKQWVNDPKRKIIIQDFKDERREFGEFTDFNNKDITNPVEVYAYFLGLYLNKMHERHIYVKYLLSYTSTFNKPALKIMEESFKRGIIKSLPKGINENLVSVDLVLDEATAYAISAIERHRESGDLIDKNGSLPTPEDPLYFGIYDFGGGTLDFSFGKYFLVIDERGDEQRHIDFEHDKTAGSSTLGCEYIIEETAFDLAYRKRELLSKHNIKCFKPPQCNRQHEKMISGNSELSRKNLRMIMDNLRKIWKYGEKTEQDDLGGYFKLYNESRQEATAIKWDEFIKNDNDSNNSDSQANINFEELYFIPKVEEGVALFFKAWSTIKKPEHAKLHIFIGGNAGRSERVVKSLTEKGKALGNITVHKALPTPADKELIDKGNNDKGYPTAKTGVVYGVLKRGDNTSIPASHFMYNIGYEIKKGAELFFGACETTTTTGIKDTYQLFRDVPISPTNKSIFRYSTDRKYGVVMDDGEESSADGSYRKELPLEKYGNLYLYIKSCGVDCIKLGVWNTKDARLNSIEEIGTFNLKTEIFTPKENVRIPPPLNQNRGTSTIPTPPQPPDTKENDDIFVLIDKENDKGDDGIFTIQ